MKIKDIELRDYFAIQALNGLIVGYKNVDDYSPTKFQQIMVEVAYQLADKMMEVRDE